MSTALLFPGQGAQTVGMGQQLAAASPRAADLFREADEVLGFSLSKLCFEGPLEELTLTKYAQPALLVNSYACYTVFKDALGEQFAPAAAAGHSLGEYTALVSAGCLSFKDAVLLVHKRGLYMQEAVEPGKGKMLAVMGPSPAEIEKEISALRSGVVEIANLNSPGQTVVSGEAAAVEEFAARLTESGAKVIPLNVSAPFHCSLMKPAADLLAADLDSITFHEPQFPVYANVTAAKITSGQEARELLKQQVCASVRWTELMENMIDGEGLSTTIEFGPGAVLSKLLKRIRKGLTMHQVFDTESAATVQQKVTASEK